MRTPAFMCRPHHQSRRERKEQREQGNKHGLRPHLLQYADTVDLAQVDVFNDTLTHVVNKVAGLERGLLGTSNSFCPDSRNASLSSVGQGVPL